MKNLIWILLMTCFSCSNNEVLPSTERDEKKPEKDFNPIPDKTKFNSIKEVFISNSSWTNLENKNRSCDLHFNLSNTDTITIEYSPECYLMFPISLKGNQISVLMSSYIDTKYDFDIVKTIEALDKKYHNQVFMELTLMNDTTLLSKYTIKGIQNYLNKADSNRILFLEKFYTTNRLSFDSYN